MTRPSTSTRDAVGEREHRVHVVLDQQDRVSRLQLAQKLDHARGTPAGPSRPSARRAAAGAARVASAIASSSCALLAVRQRGGRTCRAADRARSRQAPHARGSTQRARRCSAGRQKRKLCPACACTASATLSSAREFAEDRGDLERAGEARVRARRGGRARDVPPAKRIAPASGGSSPAICAMNVVLPAPFGPIRACVSPLPHRDRRRSVASRPPKRFTRRLTLRSTASATVTPLRK